MTLTPHHASDNHFYKVFPQRPIIGTIHLKPLPGSPAYEDGLDKTIASALYDLDSYERGGCDAVIIENFFDAPFFKDRVGPDTVAAMARLATIIRQHTKLPIGVN